MTEPVPGFPLQVPLEQVPPEERPAAIGAILFVAGGPVSLATLADHLSCGAREVREALALVAERAAGLGLALQWCREDEVQLVSAPRLAGTVQRFLGLERTVRLSRAALETLAIVAYRQPVTRGDIEAIRGVDSSGVLQTLLARGLIEAVGRLETVGNPVQYGTTPEFLRFFGLSSLDELPPLPEEAAPQEEPGPPAG